jgi:hypothetical protein
MLEYLSMGFDSSKLLQLLMGSRVQDYLGSNKEILSSNFDYLTVLSFLLWGAGISFSTYVLATMIKEKLEPEIKSGEELDKIIEEEKKKLGLTDSVIPLRREELNELIRTLSPEEVKEIMGNDSTESKQALIDSLEALKNKTIGIKLGGRYLIHFNSTPKRYLVKHELYHIKSGYFDKISKSNLSPQDILKIYVQYCLMEEPKAFLYSVFNINL